MHRGPVLDLLERYAAAHPDESGVAERIRTLVREHPDCLLRTCAPGHITASVWIASADGARFLLTHHRKLDRWLQLGGHVDGEPRLHLAALREAQEESGMERFTFVPGGDPPLPIDLDVHEIPAHGSEPRHEHHDVRYLLVADPGQALQISAESRDLRWFPVEEMGAMCGDESVLRLGRKAAALLSRARGR